MSKVELGKDPKYKDKPGEEAKSVVDKAKSNLINFTSHKPSWQGVYVLVLIQETSWVQIQLI